MAATPGMLAVTMQPKAELLPAQFHEWYNNEHGPTRLRLSHIFTSGLRYQATDAAEPSYLAAYDVTSMHHLETETYTGLRENRSPREAETIGQVDVKRYLYDFVSGKQSPSFVPIKQLADAEAEGIVLLVVEIGLTDEPDAEEEVTKWYEQEHMHLLAKRPGWLRSRLFKTSRLEKGMPTSLFAYHEYAKENGPGGSEQQASMSTKWSEEVFAKYAIAKGQRVYKLFYVFGPAPRDLDSLAQLPAATSRFVSADSRTVITNDPQPVISSYVTTQDGLSIAYRLEGNADPKAPTMALSNSLLTSLHMWDPFVEIIKSKRPQWRILRYDTRGRHAVPSPPVPATLDTLADDLKSLLEALRIPVLDLLVGVSLGGATSVKFALRRPEMVRKFIACDFNAASSPTNTNAWKERIFLAETPMEDGVPGIRKLARQTVERWFHPATMQKTDIVEWMTDMVATNDVQGFKYSCQALWDYDLRDQLHECKAQGLLVVGEADGQGALVKAMQAFKGALGEKGTDLVIVPEAGHLPMCENPEGFWGSIESFL